MPKRLQKGRSRAPVVMRGKLRQVREEAGLTQKELAQLVGISQYAISVAERTGTQLSEENWEKLAVILKSDVFTLRGWKKVFSE